MCVCLLPVAGGERDWKEKNLFLRFLLRPNWGLLEEGHWFPIDCFATKTAVARYSRCSDDEEDSGWIEEVALEGATL